MAEKEIVRIRSEFVKRVTKEILVQLLEDLVTNRFLNDLEKESILEENSSRVDRARCFIDTVKKKGDKACRKLLDHIQDIDPTLYSELGVSSAQPVTVRRKEQEWSSTLVLCTDSFWREIEDRDIYHVTETSKANRVALLITNKYFSSSSTRDGAEKDEQGIEIMLRNLNYEVVKYNDLSGKEIDEALISFSKHRKLAWTDSVFVVIMSHGGMGILCGGGRNKPSDTFPIDNIYKHLNTKNCPALLNKPKIVIIQACRGGGSGSVTVPDAGTWENVPELGRLQTDALEHEEKDFITLLACTPGSLSYRLPEYGSYLIQYIVEVFYTHSCKDDIEELFRKVMQRFEAFPPAQQKQMPTKDRCTLTKRFYLFP